MIERRLLDEVLAHPDEDIPRLVYADWWKTQGDPRGDFVAGQCRLATLDELHPDWPGLYVSTERALLRHRRAWTEPLLGLLETPLSRHDLEFERGFPERLCLPSCELPPLEPLAAQVPLRSLSVALQGEPAPLFRGCVRAGLRGLRTSGAFRADALRGLASRELSPLEALDLKSSLLSEAGARQLVRLHSGEKLRRLSLSRADDRALISLAGSGMLDRCEEIDLSENRFSERGLRRLVDREVELPLSLKLFGNHRHGRAVCELLERRPLRALALGNFDLPVQDLLSALASPPARGLRQLLLAGSFEEPSPRLAAQLAELPLEGLTHLSLSSGCVDSRGLSLLLEAQPNLVSLTLVGRELAKGVLSTLLTSPHTRRLVMLRLVDCDLDDADIELLARWPGMANLAVLNLVHNPRVGERGCRALLDCSSLDPVWLTPPACDFEAMCERFGEALG
jgi:uncharacterized protein (TIGR02996 family)